MNNVPVSAALVAGILSFLSPCVLPLVPPYMIYLTGATIEHVANDEPVGSSKRSVMISALLFVLGFSTVFVALGATASPAVHAAALDPRRRHHHCHGAAFPGADADRLFDAGGPPVHPPTRRVVWRLCEGARLWLRLDAMHRPDPCGNPVAGGSDGNGCKRGRSGLSVFHRSRNSLSGSGLHDRAFFVGVRQDEATSRTVERAMGVLLVITGIGFLTGSVSAVSIWLLETFSSLQNLGWAGVTIG
jgi:cytochrome c-type biogenesis protein